MSPSLWTCELPVDLIFLLDRSATIADAQFWQQTVGFVRDVLSPFALGQRPRVAFATFADDQTYDFPWRDLDFDGAGMRNVFDSLTGLPSNKNK